MSIDQHASVGAMPRVPLSVLTAHRVCLARDRYGRPLYNREERAARACGVPDAAELTARVAVVVGLVRPVALETLPATGTWSAVASAWGRRGCGLHKLIAWPRSRGRPFALRC